MVLEQENVNSIIVPDTKSNSKWITDLNVKPSTMKLLEENTGEYLFDLGLGKDFLDETPKTQSIKRETNKLDLIKIKDFCSSQNT